MAKALRRLISEPAASYYGTAFQPLPWDSEGETSLLLTLTATTESVSSCELMKS